LGLWLCTPRADRRYTPKLEIEIQKRLESFGELFLKCKTSWQHTSWPAALNVFIYCYYFLLLLLASVVVISAVLFSLILFLFFCQLDDLWALIVKPEAGA